MSTAEEKVERALELIMLNGGVDGAYHKQWVLDQLVRTLTGCLFLESAAKDNRDQNYTYGNLGENEQYLDWCRKYRVGEDGPETYREWDVGIAP